MINSSRVAATGLLCTPALALSLLLAPAAHATIDSFAVGCGTPLVPCQVSITTSGADRLSPVTLSVNGTTIGQGTPSGSSDGLNGFAEVTWTPPAVGAYTVTVTQGTSTRSVKVSICPPNPSSYPNLSLSPGSAVATVCNIIGSSLNSGSTSGSASILLPLFSGSAGL
ncbi:hypothetical protein [Nocardia sp. NBC_01327]|uniref:hypothetical protein n=1 Tax=Nocardia sp. NBC_01327 TaxID=2903593 RepID=UPI002E13A2DF|nr:hypothetical protein OG326_33065 [Nocardia sp. NBC_01327]